jgi:hypothetical protein
LDEGVSKSLTEEKSIEYKTQKVTPNKRIFKMVVGTKEFIMKHSEGIPLEPVQFCLNQNYPNPFNPETIIRYSLPKKSQIEIVVFNAIGQRVRVLHRGQMNAGYHEIVWNGRDDLGQPVSSGVYICRLKASKELIATRKMIFLK